FHRWVRDIKIRLIQTSLVSRPQTAKEIRRRSPEYESRVRFNVLPTARPASSSTCQPAGPISPITISDRSPFIDYYTGGCIEISSRGLSAPHAGDKPVVGTPPSSAEKAASIDQFPRQQSQTPPTLFHRRASTWFQRSYGG